MAAGQCFDMLAVFENGHWREPALLVILGPDRTCLYTTGAFLSSHSGFCSSTTENQMMQLHKSLPKNPSGFHWFGNNVGWKRELQRRHQIIVQVKTHITEV